MALGKVAAEIAAQPELGPCEIGAAVVPLVHLVCVVELAEMFGLAVLAMSGRM